MPKKKIKARDDGEPDSLENRVAVVMRWIAENADEKVREGMARYAIPSDHAVGIPVGEMRKFAKVVGRDQELSVQLWKTGSYEARMLAIFVGDPEQVKKEQMDKWCADFDNWAICDTACFHLFNETDLALARIKAWAKMEGEFQRRAAFALLACAHRLRDEEMVKCLPLIEKYAVDERNFVKKAVNWALRAIGNRNRAMHAEAVALGEKLAGSGVASARWIGKDAVRQLASAATRKRLERR